MTTKEAESIPKWSRWSKRTLISLVVFLGLLVAWHFYLSFGLSNRVRSFRSNGSESQEELSISVNPLTNLVSMTIAMPPDLADDNPFAALGSALGKAMLQTIGPGFIERELNT